MTFDWQREDLKGRFFDATLKPMEATGEVVLRVRSQVPDMHTKRVSLTKAKIWDDANNPPWQKPHLHRGLNEGYLVVKGWMIAVWRTPMGGYRVKLLTSPSRVDNEDKIIFPPNIAHNVLLGPEAEIVVWQTGEPVLNHDMDDPQDRFPCPSFDYYYDGLTHDLQTLIGQ